MGREAAFEFVVIVFMQISIVDVEVGKSGVHAIGQIIEKVWDMGAEQVRAFCLDMVAEHVVDDAVKFPVIDGGPEGVFGTGVKAAEKQIEVAFEAIGEDEEPKLVCRADVENAFKAEGAGGVANLRVWIKMNGAPVGFAVRVEGHEEAGPGEGVVVEGQPGEGGVTAEICVGALVKATRGEDICFEVLDKKAAFNIGPPGSGIGERGVIDVIEGLLGGGCPGARGQGC